MKPLSARVQAFEVSVIRRMTQLADQYKAINLSQGYPEFDPPREILEKLCEIASENVHQYAITSGTVDIRQAIAEKQSRFMGRTIDPDEEVVVTVGGTEAMMATILSLTNPGDKVAVFSPFYENYGADSILAGAEPLFVPLKAPHYALDAETLEKTLKQDVKALILCNPANPTGKVFTLEELQTIAELALKYDIYVITDEVYEHLVYPPYKHHYFGMLPGMFERTIHTNSLSKTYSITGWRLGFTIAPKPITDLIKKAHDYLTVGAAAPLQVAIVPALQFGQDYYDAMLNRYAEKRTLFLRGLDEIGLTYVEPQGAFYVLIDISEFGYTDDIEFGEDLIREVGVAGVPGSSFFHEQEHRYIRLHFAKEEETLKEALRRLGNLRQKMTKYVDNVTS